MWRERIGPGRVTEPEAHADHLRRSLGDDFGGLHVTPSAAAVFEEVKRREQREAN